MFIGREEKRIEEKTFFSFKEENLLAAASWCTVTGHIKKKREVEEGKLIGQERERKTHQKEIKKKRKKECLVLLIG